jgi:hypothetical protein
MGSYPLRPKCSPGNPPSPSPYIKTIQQIRGIQYKTVIIKAFGGPEVFKKRQVTPSGTGAELGAGVGFRRFRGGVLIKNTFWSVDFPFDNMSLYYYYCLQLSAVADNARPIFPDVGFLIDGSGL